MAEPKTGLVIALGKKPDDDEDAKPDEDGDEGGGDQYDAMATVMMRAFKKGDSDALADALRDYHGMMPPGDDYD